MSDYMHYLSKQVSCGRMSRREFLGRTAAIGGNSKVLNGLLSAIS